MAKPYLYASACLGALIATNAYAQEATAPQPEPAPESAPAPGTPPGNAGVTPAEGGLAEIVVTAQKQAENLQDVPIAVSAVTGDFIERQAITTLQGLQGSVPNVQINNFSNTPNTAVYTIRGIGVVEPDPYAGNTVSIVLDGVPQFFSMGALLDLYDIERIEVLRGPQGTLFGANTTGGVVNVVTRQPTGELGVQGEVTYGNWDRLDVKGAVDFPITDTLSGKVAYLHTERDGFVTNVVDGSDMGHRNLDVVRGYLRFDPGDAFDATAIVEYGEARNGSPPVVNGAVPGEALFVPPGTASDTTALGMYTSPCLNLTATNGCDAPDKYFSANNSVEDRSDMDTFRATLTMNLTDTAIGDITSITGYRDFKITENTDQDGTPLFLDDTQRQTDGWQFSQELRTAVDFSDTLRAIVGGFYLKTHYDHIQDFRVQFAVPGLSQVNTQDQDNYSISAFGQFYWEPIEALTLQAGIRYTHEKTEMLATLANCIDPDGTAAFGCPQELPGTIAPFGEKSWDKVGWKLGADYELNDDLLVYGYWARGFKSGGFTGRIGIASDIGPYDPETVDTFEVGFKGDFADRRIRLNAAAFYTNYRDIQVASIYFTGPNNEIQGNSILNAAKAEIKGFEFEATVLPVDALTLSGSIAYLDAKYKEFDYFDVRQSAFIDLTGVPLQNAPEWTATANANYVLDLGSAGTVTSNLQYQFIDAKILNSIPAAPRARVQETHIVNANIEYAPEDSFWSIGAWATNLFDKRYIQSVFDAPGVFGLVNYANPREYGVTAKIRF